MDFSKELALRVGRAQAAVESAGLDALYVTAPANVMYLTGREAGRVLLTKNRGFLWVRELYRGVYADLYGLKGYPLEVRTYSRDELSKQVESLGCRSIGIEDVSVSYCNRMRKSFGCRLKPTEIVEQQRAVKSGHEIRALRRSASIAVKGMKKAYEVVRKGVRELDAAAEIEYEIRMGGSETPPFQHGMLLSSGPRAADVHAHATGARIGDGLVIADLGARFQGYYSDMTRTIAAGRLRKTERELMESVRRLEVEAVDYIKPGMTGAEVHDFIESRIKAAGFSFHHSAGHGIGLEVHERPKLGPESDDVLAEGMVFTVEPGIYIPKKMGVRFEDMVLLTKKGCRQLTG